MRFNNRKKIYDFRDKAINCETEEEAKQLLKIAKNQGFKWIGGVEYDENYTYWDTYRKETVYFIIDGQYGNMFTEGLEDSAIKFKEFIRTRVLT